MSRTTGAIAALVLSATVVVSGCSNGNPCAELGDPSPAEIAAANAGAEVEIEVDGTWGETECVVQRGRWVDAGSDD